MDNGEYWLNRQIYPNEKCTYCHGDLVDKEETFVTLSHMLSLIFCDEECKRSFLVADEDWDIVSNREILKKYVPRSLLKLLDNSVTLPD